MFQRWWVKICWDVDQFCWDVVDPSWLPFLQWLYCSLHFSAKNEVVILFVCLGTVQYWWISIGSVVVQLRAIFCPSIQYLSLFFEAFSWTILDSSCFPFHSGQVFHHLVCPLTVVLPQIFFNLTTMFSYPVFFSLFRALPCHIHVPVCLWIMDPHSRAPKKNTSHGNEVLPQDATHLIHRPCYQWGSPCQDPAGSWTTRRPPDHRTETQTAVVWSCFPFIRSDQNHLARHSEREKKTRQWD